MFSINCLEITATKEQWEKNPSLYKNLLSKSDYDNFDAYKKKHPAAIFSKRFFFNDFYYHEQYGDLEPRPKEERALPDDFFGKNINIQAIVGKNGSGKSSLMDLMYMAINNFCYMFERGIDRPGADALYFIPNLYIHLHFNLSEIRYNLINENKKVKLYNVSENKSVLNNYYGTECFELGKKETTAIDKNDLKLKNLILEFFYSIVSNYSMQSFVSQNYTTKVYHYNTKEKKDKTLKNKHSWIDPIFHKNDGYIRSIVLNPYRDDGWVNLGNEYELSKDRVSALFLYSKYKDQLLFQNYQFDSISLEYDESKFIKWIYNSVQKNLNLRLQKKLKNDREKRAAIIKDFISRAQADSLICKIFKISLQNNQYKKQITRYLQIKLLKIKDKYDEFGAFRNAIKIKSQKDQLLIETNPRSFELFLNEVIKGNTHIARKIRRTINFTNYFTTTPQNIKFSEFKSYVSAVKKSPFYKIKKTTPSLIDDCLPPPIFSYQLFLKKENLSKPIPYTQLSSGEIQLLQTMSIHIYHIMNILSVSESRPKYKHINLIFDELEICFHPEYQRQFTFFLKNILEKTEITQKSDVNIFLITHSPFVLSDIPACNILYLKDGEQQKHNNYKTFGANISDLCKDSFFLENGFVGDLAKEKTNSLAKFLSSKRKNDKTWNKENSRGFIKNVIGESIVQDCLSSLFKIKYGEDL